jgi:hypothetical protein
MTQSCAVSPREERSAPVGADEEEAVVSDDLRGDIKR